MRYSVHTDNDLSWVRDNDRNKYVGVFTSEDLALDFAKAKNDQLANELVKG